MFPLFSLLSSSPALPPRSLVLTDQTISGIDEYPTQSQFVLGFRFNADGSSEGRRQSLYFPFVDNWLNVVGAGYGDAYEVQLVKTSGNRTLTCSRGPTGAGNWYDLSSAILGYITQSGVGVGTWVGDVTFRKISNHADTITAQVSITATMISAG